MTIFEAGKEYKTRDGSRARIYATDGGGTWPIHGAVFDDEDGGWIPETWTPNGRVGAPTAKDEGDLAPPVREWWLVIGSKVHHETREEAEQFVTDYERRCFGLKTSSLEIIRVREVTDE